MSELVFTIDRSQLEGKQGELKPDSEGYYEILAGAYNLATTAGEIYEFTKKVQNLFVKSTMITKLKKGQLFGEKNHPALDVYRIPGRPIDEAISLWLSRLSRIDMANLAFIAKNVRFAPLPNKVDGRTVYAVYLTLKPLCPEMLASIQDKNSNTALSVRSFVNRRYHMGEVLVETKDIVCYDWVPSGGISIATKWNSPGLEDDNSIIIPEQEPIYTGGAIETKDSAIITTDVLKHMADIEAKTSQVGVEDSVLFDTMMIRDLAGWREVPCLNSMVSTRWSR